MIPYLTPPPPFVVLGVRVSAFGVLMLAAAIAAYAVIVRRGRALAGGAKGAERLAQVVLGAGVVGAHVGGAIADHGAGVWARPGVLLSAQGSFSSAGGLVAAGVVGAAWVWRTRGDARAWADVAAAAFVVGLAIARAGCALAHDHPGRLSEAWIAVRFPGGARLDCGLLEWGAALGLAGVVLVVGRRPLGPGALAGLVGAAYVGIRFPLDFLRATDLPGADARWLGLTFAQWICLPILAGSAWIGAPWRGRLSGGARKPGVAGP